MAFARTLIRRYLFHIAHSAHRRILQVDAFSRVLPDVDLLLRMPVAWMACYQQVSDLLKIDLNVRDSDRGSHSVR